MRRKNTGDDDLQQKMDDMVNLMEASENVDTLRALVAAQRDKLIQENGFSETMAEQMAGIMWQGIWASMAAQAMRGEES